MSPTSTSTVRLSSLVVAIALAACSGKTAREHGADLAGTKIDIVAGVGDQLQAKGAEAGESLTAGVGKVVQGIQRGALKSGRGVALDPAVGEAGLAINQVTDANARSETVHALEAYVVASTGATGRLQLFAYDALDREIGRAAAPVALTAGEAKYVAFPLDAQVRLDAISRVRFAYAPRAPSAQ